jgi:colicin import membrane protein
MRFLVRFWLPLLVLALATSSFTCLAEEEATTEAQMKEKAVDVEEVINDAASQADAGAAAAAAQMEAEALAKQAAADARAAQQEAAAAAQKAQDEEADKAASSSSSSKAKKDVKETKEAAESALSNLKDKLVTLKKTVSEKTSLVTEKIKKNVSPSHAKKIAAGVLGVWGVSVGAGWVAQNINKTPEEEEVFKGGRRK